MEGRPDNEQRPCGPKLVNFIYDIEQKNKNNRRCLSRFVFSHGNTIIIKSHIRDNATNQSVFTQNEMAD